MSVNKTTLRALKIQETQRNNNPTRVQLSEHCFFYRRWIVGGFSLRQCTNMARVIYGEKISRSSFHNFKKRLPHFLLVHPETLREYEINLRRSALETKVVLESLIVEQFRRIALTRNIEKKTGLPLEIMDGVMTSIRNLCLSINKIDNEEGLRVHA